MKCNSAYWHFNVTLLSDNVFIDAVKYFWSGYTKTKAEYTSLQQWWNIGKGKIKQLCLQYTLNVTRDMIKSIKVLENEIEELQGMTNTTNNGEHFKGLKRQKLALFRLLFFFLIKVH